MNHVIDLDRALAGYLNTEATDGAPAGLLDDILGQTSARRPRRVWSAGLRQRNRSRPTVLALPAGAILVALLIVAAIAAAAFVGGRLAVAPQLPDFDHSSPEFRLTGSMSVARVDATAVRLADGTVLIVGGWGFVGGGAPAFATAEIYDPRTGQFRMTGSMTQARTRASATLMRDGRVLVAGGYVVAPINAGGSPDAIASAEVYDPASGTFTQVGPMHESRAGHGAVLLASGEVVVVGGVGGTLKLTETSRTEIVRSTFERFDPATGRFTLATDPLPSPIGRPTIALLGDGRVLVGNVSGPPSYQVLIYDPSSGAVEATSQAGIAVEVAAGLRDGRVLVISGGDHGESQVYDPNSDTFGPIVSFERGPEQAVVTEGGGLVILFGRSSVEGSEVGNVDAFDPVTGRIAKVGPMAVIRTSGFTATPLRDGTILVTGGWAAGEPSRLTSSAELLVP